MKPPVVALFERSLRLESRSALMGWSRTGFLGLIFFLLIPIQTMARAGWYGAPGLQFLNQMVWINLVLITLAGVGYFASAITEEKEEMMLGLLRMTDLNSISILLGKSTSRLVGALLLLLVQIPFVLLAVTLGGVGVVQIAAAYGTLLAYLFLVCNLALFLSVVCRTTAIAAGIVLFLLLVFLIGVYMADAMVQGFAAFFNLNPNRGICSLLTTVIELWKTATPSERLTRIFRTGFAGPVIGFQIVSNLVLGLVCFFLAWLVFDRCTRDEKEAAPARRWVSFLPVRRRRIPDGVSGPRAITWKDFTYMGGGRSGLLSKFIVGAVIVGVCNMITEIEGSQELTREFLGGTIIFVFIAMTAICLALDASRVFREEIRWKTLSSLVTLPVSVAELAYRKVLGVLAGTLPLLIGVLFGAMLVPDAVFKFLDGILNHSEAFFGFSLVILQFILFLHLTAFLSLVIKRGALPLAVAIQYLGGTFCMTFIGFSVGQADGMFFISGFACAALTIVLHRAIGVRLARAAAEE